MEFILIIAYTAWSYFVGSQLLTGKFWWLDEPIPLNRICKIILCLIVGYFVGGIYLIYLLIKLLWSIF